MGSDSLAIPGVAHIMVSRDIPRSALLLLGASGSSKTMYCRQFLLDGLQPGDSCLMVSSLDDRQLQDLSSKASQSLDRLSDPHVSRRYLPASRSRISK